MSKIDRNVHYDFDDVLMKPQVCERNKTIDSRAGISIERTFKFMHGDKTITRTYVPIIAANMDHIGTFEMAKIMCPRNMMVCLHKYYSAQDIIGFCDSLNPIYLQYVAVTCGLEAVDRAKLDKVLAETKIDTICLDVANGYLEVFRDLVRDVRTKYPNHIIIAGNVVTGARVATLIQEGADIVKVGIGSGSVCTTRLKTGVGAPQLSAVLECADAAHNLKGHIISDGGIKVPGDACKAFGAGADFIMLGSYLAGHDETGQNFYGSSSREAMMKHKGAVASYKATEGRSVCLKNKGPVSASLDDLCGGIRSSCSYLGATEIRYMHRRAQFVVVNRQINPLFPI